MKRQIEIENLEEGSIYVEARFSYIIRRMLTYDEYDRIKDMLADELLRITEQP